MTTDSLPRDAGPRCLLRLNSVAAGVGNLGPSPAAVLWCQGCEHRPCRQCMSPETWNPAAGAGADVVDVARWLDTTASRFLTVSGGEPFEQAAGLNGLLRLLGDEWIVTVYTGFDLAPLRAGAEPEVAALLGRVDLLIAGPYVPERHAPLLWRGSDNQQIHNLTGRAPVPRHDVTAGVTVQLTEAGIEAIGVPPAPGFLPILRAQARQRGIRLRRSDAPRTFPFPVQES